MADKQVTVAVPEERVPEFYAWFASFLAAEPGAAPPLAGGGRAARAATDTTERLKPGRRRTPTRPSGCIASSRPRPASCLTYSPPAPGARFGGEDIAKRLKLEKGAHGVAGILAWPGRYSRHLDRTLPIATEGRPDGGTDYYMDPELAELFTAARASSPTQPRQPATAANANHRYLLIAGAPTLCSSHHRADHRGPRVPDTAAIPATAVSAPASPRCLCRLGSVGYRMGVSSRRLPHDRLRGIGIDP